MDVILRVVHANEACVERRTARSKISTRESAGTLRGEIVAVAACRSVLPESTRVDSRKFPKKRARQLEPSMRSPRPPPRKLT